MPKSKLILASSSPRRLQILNNLGLSPDLVIPADIDETPLKGESPAIYCKRIAKEKALKIRSNQENNDSFIISGDTIASLGRRIIGKANNSEEAKNILKLMSGRKHKVYSAICAIAPDGTLRQKMTITQVSFKNLSHDEIDEYIATNHWQGKAGAYGLQENPGGFVKTINGSFSGVIGLPAYEAKCLLLGLGFNK